MALTPNIISRKRVFPYHPTPKKTITLLSLCDAASAICPLSGAVWYFPRLLRTPSTPIAQHLQEALRKTLDAYPQWCGFLRLAPYEPGSSGHGRHGTQQYGRIELCHGTSSDPGVEFVVGSSASRLQDLMPSAEERTSKYACWNRKDTPSAPWLPSTPLALPLSDAPETRNPCVIIQITTLACGGMVIAVNVSHVLADGPAFLHFVRDWSKVSAALLLHTPLPSLYPLFRPALLDEKIPGDASATEPDAALLEKAYALPLHRYDFWTSLEGAPLPVMIPAPFASDKEALIGNFTRMPWLEWDPKAPLSHYIIHYTRDQVQSIYKDASSTAASISKHDAIQAHVWMCINRARGVSEDDDPLYCDMALGLRSRLGLGDAFLGSALIIVHAELSRQERSQQNISAVAQCIRSSLEKFDGPALEAHLHSLAHEKTPQRLWQTFLGPRHILVTSWAHHGQYHFDFGTRTTPQYVDAIMPEYDGVVQVGEAPPVNPQATQDAVSPWWNDGVDVSIHIGHQAMERLLSDPLLLPQV